MFTHGRGNPRLGLPLLGTTLREPGWPRRRKGFMQGCWAREAGGVLYAEWPWGHSGARSSWNTAQRTHQPHTSPKGLLSEGALFELS